MDILPVFCDIDDFCLLFEPMWQRQQLAATPHQRHRASSLALSEVMTIIVLFHTSGYRNFRDLLHRTRLKADACRIPEVDELQPICGVDAICARALMLLPAHPTWRVQRNLIC